MHRKAMSVLGGLLIASSMTTAVPAIDWGKAGQIVAPTVPELPQDKKPVDTSGFECRSRTKFSVENGYVDADGRPRGPTTVQTCSRDGLSIEIGPTN